MRTLSKTEAKEWPKVLLAYNELWEHYSNEALEQEAESLLCEMEKLETKLLLMEKIYNERHGNTNWVPLPFRKSLEAMKLAFPQYRKESVNL
jgi:hypothetical protein